MEKTHSREEILQHWREAIPKTTPTVIDKAGFIALYDQARRSESSIIFLTARSEIMRHTTYRQIRDYLYPAKEGQIYFAEKKGPVLQKILKEKFPEHTHIIFVDDHLPNHHSVMESLSDSSYTLDAYLFQGEGLE